jgi:hypothetical protein
VIDAALPPIFAKHRFRISRDRQPSVLAIGSVKRVIT